MDLTAAASVAASSPTQDAISLNLIKSANNLAAAEAQILMGSLGIGNTVDAFA